MNDGCTFRAGDRVRYMGVTALRGRVGTVRGVRMGDPYQCFVFFDDRLWPALPENGIWAPETALEPAE